MAQTTDRMPAARRSSAARADRWVDRQRTGSGAEHVRARGRWSVDVVVDPAQQAARAAGRRRRSWSGEVVGEAPIAVPVAPTGPARRGARRGRGSVARSTSRRSARPTSWMARLGGAGGRRPRRWPGRRACRAVEPPHDVQAPVAPRHPAVARRRRARPRGRPGRSSSAICTPDADAPTTSTRAVGQLARVRGSGWRDLGDAGMDGGRRRPGTRRRSHHPVATTTCLGRQVSAVGATTKPSVAGDGDADRRLPLRRRAPPKAVGVPLEAAGQLTGRHEAVGVGAVVARSPAAGSSSWG